MRLDVDISGVTEDSTAMSHESHVLDRTLPSDPSSGPELESSDITQLSLESHTYDKTSHRLSPNLDNTLESLEAQQSVLGSIVSRPTTLSRAYHIRVARRPEIHRHISRSNNRSSYVNHGCDCHGSIVPSPCCTGKKKAIGAMVSSEHTT